MACKKENIPLRKIFMEVRGINSSDYVNSLYINDYNKLKKIIKNLYEFVDNEECKRQLKKLNKLSKIVNINPFSKCIYLALMSMCSKKGTFISKLSTGKYSDITNEEKKEYLDNVFSRLENIDYEYIKKYLYNNIYPYKDVKIKRSDVDLNDKSISEEIRNGMIELINEFNNGYFDGFISSEKDLILETEIKLSDDEIKEKILIEWKNLLSDIYLTLIEEIELFSEDQQIINNIKEKIGKSTQVFFKHSSHKGIIYPILDDTMSLNNNVLFDSIFLDKGYDNDFISDIEYEDRLKLYDMLNKHIENALANWEKEAINYINQKL